MTSPRPRATPTASAATGTSSPPPASSSPAEYRSYPVDEWDSNPLIAALPPPPLSDEEATLRMGCLPAWKPEELGYCGAYRRMLVPRLQRFFLPMKEHCNYLSAVYSQIFSSYVPRNPLTRNGQAYLHGYACDQPVRSTISMLSALSGHGKSRFADQLQLALGPQWIAHRDFKGQAFPEKQLTYLRINLLPHCSAGALCSDFGNHISRATGMSEYAQRFKTLRHKNIAGYLEETRAIFKSLHLGLLVIDEFQNLSTLGYGQREIVALLVWLRDELGAAILLIGTPRVRRLFDEGGMPIRIRLAEGGYFNMPRALSGTDEGWQDFCKLVWRFQWVREPQVYGEDAGLALFECSQGVRGIMLRVFQVAQQRAITDGSEQVTPESIREAFERDDALSWLRAPVRLLQAANPSLLAHYEDLYTAQYPDTSHTGLIEPQVADALAKVASTKAGRGRAAKNIQGMSDEELLKLVQTDDDAVRQLLG